MKNKNWNISQAYAFESIVSTVIHYFYISIILFIFGQIYIIYFYYIFKYIILVELDKKNYI